jgi:hypothetical protein
MGAARLPSKMQLPLSTRLAFAENRDRFPCSAVSPQGGCRHADCSCLKRAGSGSCNEKRTFRLRTACMPDALFILLTLLFFAVALLYVRACERV